MKKSSCLFTFALKCFFLFLLICPSLCFWQNESCFRQDFLLKYKNRTEQDEIETRENLNRLLLENVLPAHVAALFVGENKKNEVRLQLTLMIFLNVVLGLLDLGSKSFLCSVLGIINLNLKVTYHQGYATS